MAAFSRSDGQAVFSRRKKRDMCLGVPARSRSSFNSSSISITTISGGDHLPSQQLPDDILRSLVKHADPSTCAVLKHVSRSLASHVREKEAASKRLFPLRIGTLAGTEDSTRWAFANGCPRDSRVSASLAGLGHLAAVQWAWERGCPVDESTAAAAAAGGHRELLSWLLGRQCPWDEWVCIRAAGGGFVELLAWARSQGAPMDDYAAAEAAATGHLNVLRWVREQGEPIDYNLCRTAAVACRQHAVLEWLHGLPSEPRSANKTLH